MTYKPRARSSSFWRPDDPDMAFRLWMPSHVSLLEALSGVSQETLNAHVIAAALGRTPGALACKVKYLEKQGRPVELDFRAVGGLNELACPDTPTYDPELLCIILLREGVNVQVIQAKTGLPREQIELLGQTHRPRPLNVDDDTTRGVADLENNDITPAIFEEISDTAP